MTTHLDNPRWQDAGSRGPFRATRPAEVRNGVPEPRRYVYGAARRWWAERNTAKPWDEPDEQP